MADFENPEGSNTSNNESFQDVLYARLSRRGFVSGGVTAAAALALTGADSPLRAVPASAKPRPAVGPLLGFTRVPVSSADTVTVPPGYTADVLIAWGDPASDGPEFGQDGSNSADDQARQ